MNPVPLLVVAGEASGDLHGAHLLRELHALRDDVQAFGLGGERMAAVGFDPIADVRDVAVVGITEVVRMLPRIRKVFNQLLHEAVAREVKTAVLIDFPDFNLRLAKHLSRRGVRVVYYVSPQIWAWRKGRVKAIARAVSEMLVLFPFEVTFYEEAGVAVQCVGHPLVEEVPPRETLPASPTWQEPFRIALLPGSRDSEVRNLLPTMLGALEVLAKRQKVTAVLILARTVSREMVEKLVADSATRGSRVEISQSSAHRFERVVGCHVALCASGTATLEVGLLETPLVVLYRLGRGTYALAKWLVDLPHVSLVNLVLREGVVPELLQDQANPVTVAASVQKWIDEPAAVEAVRQRLARLRDGLGSTGASARAARAVSDNIDRATLRQPSDLEVTT